MQQRVSLCRSLIGNPRVMLMDEPFSALDALTRSELAGELQRVHMDNGATVVFVTHSIDEAVLLADRVVVLSPRPGRIREVRSIDIPRPRTLGRNDAPGAGGPDQRRPARTADDQGIAGTPRPRPDRQETNVRTSIFIEPHRGADYDDQLRFARAVEELGFEGLLRADHYQSMGDGDGLPGPTDAWLTLAALARETTRIRLGTLVTSATFRPPGPLAIMAAQVDRMSGGRLDLGIGAGWYEREHRSYGLPFPPTANVSTGSRSSSPSSPASGPPRSGRPSTTRAGTGP